MSVCVSILSGGCSHPCSFRKSPNAIPRAYKASFSIRKETAVKAADGLALRGPELGLTTLLLPGMILVVSCGQAEAVTEAERRTNESVGLGSGKEKKKKKDSGSGALRPLPSWSPRGPSFAEPGFHGAGLCLS